MVINRNLTNEEILANDSIRKKVDSGQIVVIDKVQTSNPDYDNLYFIGLVDGLATGTTQVSDLAAQLLGWDNSGIPLELYKMLLKISLIKSLLVTALKDA